MRKCFADGRQSVERVGGKAGGELLCPQALGK